MTTLTIKRKPSFYDSQIRRYLVQVLSCFSGFTVQTGLSATGSRIVKDVPVIFGDYSRAVGYIMNGGGDNNIPSIPIMSLDMTGFKQSAEYRRSPQHYEKISYFDRAANIDGTMGSTKGDMKTIERYMPVPYEMRLRLSIWTSNNDQGYQLVEQMATYFNPSLEIQLSNSPFDWTFLTNLNFEGEVHFSRVSADIGAGTGDDPYHVYALDFNMIVQISPPVKLYKGHVIESVHADIKRLNDEIDWDTMDTIDGLIITGSD